MDDDNGIRITDQKCRVYKVLPCRTPDSAAAASGAAKTAAKPAAAASAARRLQETRCCSSWRQEACDQEGSTNKEGRQQGQA